MGLAVPAGVGHGMPITAMRERCGACSPALSTHGHGPSMWPMLKSGRAMLGDSFFSGSIRSLLFGSQGSAFQNNEQAFSRSGHKRGPHATSCDRLGGGSQGFGSCPELDTNEVEQSYRPGKTLGFPARLYRAGASAWLQRGECMVPLNLARQQEMPIGASRNLRFPGERISKPSDH
jgi:hypothetical protein